MNPAKVIKHFLIIVLSASFIGALSLVSCKNPSRTQQKKNNLSLAVVYPPSLTSYMKHIERIFHDAPESMLADGTKVKLNLIGENSLSASAKISSGKLKVHGWLAPSTSLVNFTNNNLKNLGPKQSDCVQIFASPVVIATHQKYLSRFTSKGNTFQWSNLFEEQINNKDKQKSLYFNHPSPLSSGTGLASLIQITYASLGSPGMLDTKVLEAPRTISRLEKFEQLTSGYGYNDRTLLNQVAWAKNEKVHYTITSEQEIALYNLNRKRQGHEPLITLYPEDGSYWIDYVMCVSDADWLSPAHRKAIENLNTFLLSEPQQTSAVSLGFRPAGGAVALIPPLTPEYGIDVSQGKTALLPVSGEAIQILLDRWPEILKPAAVLFVLDLSGSMEGPSLRVAKTNFRNTIASTSWRDLKGLMSFASGVKVEKDFTTEGEVLIPVLDKLQAQGGSSIYDGILKASNLILKDELKNYRKSIVVFTDGSDKNSEITLQRLLDSSRDIFNKNNINLIIVAVGHDDDFRDMTAVAEAANGIFVHSSYDDLAELFSRIRSML